MSEIPIYFINPGRYETNLWRFNGVLFATPAIADLDGDNDMEVVIAGGLGSKVISLDGKAEVTDGCMDGRVYAVDYNF